MNSAPRRAGRITPTSGLDGGRRKLTDWAYAELKEAILDLRLRPGEPLREATIAESLGISKTPVREALAWLEHDGLVETEVFKGAVVTGYSRRDLEEIYELRELLEVAAAREAAASMEEQAGKQLSVLSEECRHALRLGHSRRLAQLIDEFDTVLFDNLRNRRIRALVSNLRDHLTRIGHLTEDIPGRLESSVAEHDRIVKAIISRDVEAAGVHMRDHILSVRAEQLALLDDEAGTPVTGAPEVMSGPPGAASTGQGRS